MGATEARRTVPEIDGWGCGWQCKKQKQSNSTGGDGGGGGTQTDGGGGGGGNALPPGAAVSIVPAGLNLDTAHSMSLQTMPANSRSDPTQPRQMVARVINGVHPGTAGQGQIADAFFGPGLNSSWEITTLFCFNDAFERKMDLLSTNFL